VSAYYLMCRSAYELTCRVGVVMTVVGHLRCW
jgi:hypothetical protein